MQELWAFYSRFLEEQANDKIKVVRSRGDNTLAAKLEAMEWMSRYLTFVPSSSVQAINREFKKEFMTAQPGPQRQAMATLTGHASEGVATVVTQLRNLKRQMEREPAEIDVHAYDQQNALQCSILENILLNNQNVKQLTEMRGLADLARLMQEQPLASELDGEFEYNSQFVNQSFKPALKCIMQSVRDEKAILEFMVDPAWMERWLQVAEEFSDEEVTITVLRALKLIFRSDQAFDKLTGGYPSMGEFICQMIQAYTKSTGIVFEAFTALDVLLRKPHYIRLISKPFAKQFETMKSEPRLNPLKETIERIVYKLKQK